MNSMVMRLVLPALALFAQDGSVGEILGLQASKPIFLGEGPTNTGLHPKSVGKLKAVMLFAQFPDGEEDLSMQELHDRLVPEAAKALHSASYGRFELAVDPHFEWFPMDGKSSDPGYDCSQHEPHKAYISEVVAAADENVDFDGYSLIYVVANKAPGTHNSPTFNAHRGTGFRADGHEIRHAVTFGNDIRRKDWGWQTLVHETGHVFGLPDLYSYNPEGDAYKNVHPYTGSWSPMGFQCHSRHFLAWHKYKLGWLDADDFEIVRKGKRTVELASIDQDDGLRAVVLPISETEAYVLEARALSKEHSDPGVLVYWVSVATPSGKGPIRVVPCTPDDDERHPDLARRYISLYNALYGDGTTFQDEDAGVRVAIRKGSEAVFALEIVRQR